jgi:hypothetical protein
MSKEAINKGTNYGYTALMTCDGAIFLLRKLWACINKMEGVINTIKNKK